MEYGGDAMIKKIVIFEEDRVGLIADLSYVLGKEKINIESIDAAAVDGKAVITIGVPSAKYSKAVEALVNNKFQMLPEEKIIIKIEDKAGSLAAITTKLADAKVHIEAINVIAKKGDYVYDTISVDKPKIALKVLAQYIVSDF
jgi:hypothetical protein